MLESAGHPVSEATNGQEALHEILVNRPVAIIMDLATSRSLLPAAQRGASVVARSLEVDPSKAYVTGVSICSALHDPCHAKIALLKSDRRREV